MARRHNSITYPRPDTTVLNGLTGPPGSNRPKEITVAWIPGREPRCDLCGYLLARCGCPGSPRMNGRAVTTVPLPVGCPRCPASGRCGCGYQPHNCTCEGGPRGDLATARNLG